MGEQPLQPPWNPQVSGVVREAAPAPRSWPPQQPGQAPIGADRQRGPFGSAVRILGLVAIFALAAAAALFAVGAIRDASEKPSGPAVTELVLPEVPDGYQLVSDKTKGYAFVVPADWTAADFDSATLDQMIEVAREKNPPAAAMIEQFRNAGSQNALAFALESSDAGGLIANVNVMRFAVSGGGLAKAVEEAEVSLNSINAKVLDKSDVTVGGRKGVKVAIEMQVPGGPAPLRQQQLYLDAGDHMYVATVSGADDATAAGILDSLRGN